MPNYFTLTRKDMPEAGPVNLSTIDEELCILLEEAIHHDYWCHNWYNSVGLMLAMGKSFDECREIFKDSEDPGMFKILDYLDENFTTDAWYQHGR